MVREAGLTHSPAWSFRTGASRNTARDVAAHPTVVGKDVMYRALRSSSGDFPSDARCATSTIHASWSNFWHLDEMTLNVASCGAKPLLWCYRASVGDLIGNKEANLRLYLCVPAAVSVAGELSISFLWLVVRRLAFLSKTGKAYLFDSFFPSSRI